jgi:hypothetical protein
MWQLTRTNRYHSMHVGEPNQCSCRRIEQLGAACWYSSASVCYVHISIFNLMCVVSGVLCQTAFSSSLAFCHANMGPPKRTQRATTRVGDDLGASEQLGVQAAVIRVCVVFSEKRSCIAAWTGNNCNTS